MAVANFKALVLYLRSETEDSHEKHQDNWTQDQNLNVAPLENEADVMAFSPPVFSTSLYLCFTSVPNTLTNI